MRFLKVPGRAALVGLSAALLCLVLGESASHAPTQPTAPLASQAGQTGSSCKPTAPLQLQIAPSTDESSDSWNLTLQNRGAAQRVIIWVWSELPGLEPERTLVWQGEVQEMEERRLDVTYRPHADASQVRALAEVSVEGESVVRGLASAAIPGRVLPQELDKSIPGRLLVLPSGERVFEVTGTTGGGR